MSKKTKAADDSADRMLETYSRQTEALDRIATTLAIIADAPKPRRRADVEPPTTSQTSG